jgi:hypothetical protein
MLALSPSTSPGSEILVMIVLPAFDAVESFTRPLQRINTPRGFWPSMNKTAASGYIAVDFMSFNLCSAGTSKAQKRWSLRIGHVRQLSRMFIP